MSSTDLSRSDLHASSDFVRWLREQGAHHDLVSYVEGRGEGLDAFWATCPRGDWMLALLARSDAHESLIAIGAKVAQLALDQLADDATRARNMLAKLDAGTSIEEHEIEALEAEIAQEGDPAAHHAKLAVVIAARAHQAPGDVPNLVPVLVQAAVFDAGDCAAMAVIGYVQRRAADAVRTTRPHLRVSAG